MADAKLSGGNKQKEKFNKLDPESDKCRDCQTKVTKEDNALFCEICRVWYHITCQNVSEEIYEILKNTLHWYCKGCDKGASNILGTLTRLEEKQNTFELELKKIVVDVQKTSAEND